MDIYYFTEYTPLEHRRAVQTYHREGEKLKCLTSFISLLFSFLTDGRHDLTTNASTTITKEEEDNALCGILGNDGWITVFLCLFCSSALRFMMMSLCCWERCLG